ncbi:MAG: DUF4416 family protein [Candidatus Omnitrophica bacterium]|nr:DUF4416 family protein [Candidatus Omnitrophota bacterium]
MACASKPSPVKLVVGTIFSSEGVLIKAKKKLENRFGPVDFASEIMAFDFTDYYEKEMGKNLKRQFLSFEKLVWPSQLWHIKRYTNRLERDLRGPASGHSRNINLDPGYIAASKLVLATCKNYSHRIYLDKGIYAEVTLSFRDGVFEPWPWTYPDYRSDRYIHCFNTIRELYLKQIF